MVVLKEPEKLITGFDPICHFTFTQANYSCQVSFYQVKPKPSLKSTEHNFIVRLNRRGEHHVHLKQTPKLNRSKPATNQLC